MYIMRVIYTWPFHSSVKYQQKHAALCDSAELYKLSHQFIKENSISVHIINVRLYLIYLFCSFSLNVNTKNTGDVSKENDQFFITRSIWENWSRQIVSPKENGNGALIFSFKVIDKINTEIKRIYLKILSIVKIQLLSCYKRYKTKNNVDSISILPLRNIHVKQTSS